MKTARLALAGILALFAAATASAQQFPTVPNHTVIGRVGVIGDTGPSQAIPFANFVALMLTSNAVGNNALTQGPPATVKCNPLAVTANLQDCAIQSLLARGAPDANNDKLLIFDAASGTLKYVTPGLIASAATSGVSSLDGQTGALTGADLNILNAKTANYTIATGDCGKTIQAGTGSTGFFTITLPAVAGFDTKCTVTVKNGDTYPGGRGKALSGFPSDLNTILWPLQSTTVKIINGVWATTYNPGRWKNPSVVTLCADTTGSNTNDGLAGTGSGCVHDANQAGLYIMTQFDLNQTVPIIATACGQTQTVQLALQGLPVGNNLIQLSPNCSSGSAAWSNAGACINVQDASELTINVTGVSSNFTFSCNTGNSLGLGAIYCHNYCTIDLFGPGTFVFSGGGGNDSGIYVDGPGTLSVGNANVFQLQGTFGNFITMNEGGKMTFSGNSQPNGAITVGRLFEITGRSMLVLSGTQSAGYGSIGASRVFGNSVIINNGVTVPGGITASGSGHNCSSLTDTTC